MNEHDTRQHHPRSVVPDPIRERPEASHERPEASHERPEPDLPAATTPEAVRAAQVARDDKRHALVRGQGVEWVRPTDLLAQHSATIAGQGIDFQTELARRARAPLAAGMRRLNERVRRLPPVSAFGRHPASRTAPVRSVVGMR
jgi:hypothetical protein